MGPRGPARAAGEGRRPSGCRGRTAPPLSGRCPPAAAPGSAGRGSAAAAVPDARGRGDPERHWSGLPTAEPNLRRPAQAPLVRTGSAGRRSATAGPGSGGREARRARGHYPSHYPSHVSESDGHGRPRFRRPRGPQGQDEGAGVTAPPPHERLSQPPIDGRRGRRAGPGFRSQNRRSEQMTRTVTRDSDSDSDSDSDGDSDGDSDTCRRCRP